jgi:hypothetical protein
MRVCVCAPQVPFSRGGAEIHVDSLVAELRRRGFEAELVSLPYFWHPRIQLLKSAFAWRLVDLRDAAGRPPDLVIGTKFPSYLVRHPNKVVWLIHQFRQVYDLLGTPYSDFADTPEDRSTAKMIHAMDTRALSEADRIYTNIVGEVDPVAILQPPRVLSQVYQGNWYFYLGTIAALTIIVGILVALAASGIFAIMSFAVSERTREIGIRRSLGERSSALALRIGRRSSVQIALGAVLGVWPAMTLYRLTQLGYTPPTATSGLGAAVVSGAAVAFIIGALACVSPTRRALRIEPSEALRAEG